jgi:polyhydroxyalkanoate synthesis repressor PhaR
MQATKHKEEIQAEDNRVIVKKYPNRRLYNTNSSSYVTLEDLRDLVKEGQEFVVVDAKTNEDLTAQILTQIILELESQGYNMLPIGFLRSIISFYGNSKMQPVVPHYLEMMMNHFNTNQDKVRQMMDNAMGNFSTFSPFGEISKQNMSFFNQAMQMFNPLGYFAGQERPAREKKASGNK